MKSVQSKPFDVIVIGAGPAGSAAAITALRHGASVAIIDKAAFPRVKLCGGLITGRCAQHLKDVFDRDIDATLFETRHSFEFFMQGQRLALMQDVPEAHLTMRYDMDDALFKQARAQGAHDYTNQRIAKIDLEAQSITLEHGERLQFSCLIGADGVRSLVARTLFGEDFDKSKIGFALEIEDQSVAPTQDTPIRVDFAAAAWGYGWSFPKRGSTTIGVGGLQQENTDIKGRLADYLTLLGTGEGVKVKGHFLPFGDYRKKPGRGRILLAGDAALFVDPITGEGIGYAVQSGALAGEAAAKAVSAGQPETAYRRYHPATRPIRTALFCARILRPIIFARRLQPFFKSVFRNSRTLKHDYMRLLAGQMEYPTLLARTFIRLPGAMMRFVWRRMSVTDASRPDRTAG